MTDFVGIAKHLHTSYWNSLYTKSSFGNIGEMILTAICSKPDLFFVEIHFW